MFANSQNVERYWLDLFRHNKGPSRNRKHSDILEIDNIRELILNIIKTHDVQNKLPKNISKNRPREHEKMTEPRIRMAIYLPLDIHLYDKQGNHTGPIIDENGNKVIEETSQTVIMI